MPLLNTRGLVLVLLLASAASAWSPAAICAQRVGNEGVSSDGDDEWSRFGAHTVGTWEAEDSRHVFTWGVGKRVVFSRSYFPTPDGWSLVSEGIWYWDPSIEAIRGTTIAIGMPVELLQYTTRLEGDDIVHELRAVGPMGGDYVERWRMEPDGYAWTLEQDGQQVMEGRYRRVGPASGAGS